MSTIDIISIHNSILRRYQQSTTPCETKIEEATRHDYVTVGSPGKEKEEDYEKWKQLYESLQWGNTSKMIVQDIHEKIKDLETDTKKSQNQFYFYLLRVIPLLDHFYSLRKQRQKIYFVSKPATLSLDKPSAGLSEELDKVIHEYLSIVELYFPEEYKSITFENGGTNMEAQHPLKVVKSGSSSSSASSRDQALCSEQIKCPFCETTEATPSSFSLCDNHFVCNTCGFVSASTYHNNISFKDIDRVNISSKYSYDRRTHFRDCINQYQGKQNVTIDPGVYDDIRRQLVLHRLIPDNYKELPVSEAFQDITKEQILIFLKETGHSKHYEDIVLIFHHLTQKPVPDISYLENDLLHDFDLLTELYDQKYKKTERKNFINTQYVLFQLLRRHKYPCKKEDFNILKTIDRKYYHDTICADLFVTLGWNFQALF